MSHGPLESDNQSRTSWRIEIFVTLVVATCMLVTIFLYYAGNAGFLSPLTNALEKGLNPQNFPWLCLCVMLGSLFPLSALAYSMLEVPGIVRQVERDCEMLGLRDTDRNSAEHPGKRLRAANFVVHYSPAVLATIIGVTLLFRKPDGYLEINCLEAMRFGFLGAYVYCTGLIYRRYTTYDLQPHVYLSCTGTLLSGMIFNYVAFKAIDSMASNPNSQTEFTGVAAGVSAILAFSLGYFPNLAISWFGRLAQTAFKQNTRRSDDLPLSLIDGISNLHEARLRDHGIDNVQNLASASIRDLVIKTPFDAQQIIDWIDQAVLLLYLDSTEINPFRKAGVRCVTDFRDQWLRMNETPSGGSGGNTVEAKVKAFALLLGTHQERPQALYDALQYGPNMDFVTTYWSNVAAMQVRARREIVQKVLCQVGYESRLRSRDGHPLGPGELLSVICKHLLPDGHDGQQWLDAKLHAKDFYGIAWLNCKIGNYDRAEAWYKDCVRHFPSESASYNDLAWLYSTLLKDKTKFNEALEWIDKAIHLEEQASPRSSRTLAVYYDTKAHVWLLNSQYSDALKEINESLRLWSLLEKRPHFGYLSTKLDIAQHMLTTDQDATPGCRVVREVMQVARPGSKLMKRAEKLLQGRQGL